MERSHEKLFSRNSWKQKLSTTRRQVTSKQRGKVTTEQLRACFKCCLAKPGMDHIWGGPRVVGKISNFTSVFPTSESHKVYSKRTCGFFSPCWMERKKTVTSTYSFFVWRRQSNIKSCCKVSWLKAILWGCREPLPVIQRLDKIKKEGKSAEAGGAHLMQPGVLLIIMSSIADNPPMSFSFQPVMQQCFLFCLYILHHYSPTSHLQQLAAVPFTKSPLLFKGKCAVLFVMTS